MANWNTNFPSTTCYKQVPTLDEVLQKDFPCMLVDASAKPSSIDRAHMVGTFAECGRYALKHGIRSMTKIIQF